MRQFTVVGKDVNDDDTSAPIRCYEDRLLDWITTLLDGKLDRVRFDPEAVLPDEGGITNHVAVYEGYLD